MSRAVYDERFSFHEQLWQYYERNKRKIRSRYNELTKKFLAYNDREMNPDAFLRPPQFEALEMYVLIKEFLGNRQMHELFEDWRHGRGRFSDRGYYSSRRDLQQTLLDYTPGGHMPLSDMVIKQMDSVFSQMKKYRENYPNYIYALTMGLGKTILMATCIFYEFLLANKYGKDERFCRNVLVFAPDRTVLQSLREIVTFDKTQVVPPEYARVLDSLIKFHFLEESGTTLNAIDGSEFNIVISNTQKIIVKKKHKEASHTTRLYDGLLDFYNDDESDELRQSGNLTINQRFMKLCRLPSLGIYVDEAHHLFGADLEKQLRSDANKTSQRATINMLAADLKANGGKVVACYNYTGTPFVKNQVLPEVVYSYGLRESIHNSYLKDCEPIAYDNVKDEQFLDYAVTEFWERYGGNTYEGLLPKLAIFAADISEAVNVVRPSVEKILARLGVPLSRVLLNVGDTTYTKDADIRNFNNLDVIGTEGSKKQFLILVNKGKEGWNCRSLFAVALFRKPKSKVFVLQATMRCLRKITDEQQEAVVFLSRENFTILDEELRENFNVEIKDLKNPTSDNKGTYEVRLNPPPVTLKLRTIKYEYSLEELEPRLPIDFGIRTLDLSKYEAKKYVKSSLVSERTVKEEKINTEGFGMKYSCFSLAGEIACYMSMSPILVNRLLCESMDGADVVVDVVSRHNEVLYDVIVPKIFQYMYKVHRNSVTEEKTVTLLHEPKGKGYYEFRESHDLVIGKNYPDYEIWKIRSFHADTYCFASKPEKELFLQYVNDQKRVDKVYFTGMFTSQQGDFAVQYFDPDSGRIRRYYPDFYAVMSDGSYQIVEVKGDNRIDDPLVKIKEAAARELALESGVSYVMYAGSLVMKYNVLERDMSLEAQMELLDSCSSLHAE